MSKMGLYPTKIFKNISDLCKLTPENKDLVILIEKLYNELSKFLCLDYTTVENEINVLAICVLRFVKYLKIACTSTLDVVNRHHFKKWHTLIADLSSINKIKTKYVCWVVVPVFNTVLDNDLPLWFSKDILQNCNIAINGSDITMRNFSMQMNIQLIEKLLSKMLACGDYEYQEIIIEIIFKMCSDSQLVSNVRFENQLFLKTAFSKIKRNDLRTEIRNFLTVVNLEYKTIISVKTNQCHIENIIVPESVKDASYTWVDINLHFQTISISFYMNGVTVLPNGHLSQEYLGVKLIVIDYSHIEEILKTRYYSITGSRDIGNCYYIRLNTPCSLALGLSNKILLTKLIQITIHYSNQLVIFENYLQQKFKFKDLSADNCTAAANSGFLQPKVKFSDSNKNIELEKSHLYLAERKSSMEVNYSDECNKTNSSSVPIVYIAEQNVDNAKAQFDPLLYVADKNNLVESEQFQEESNISLNHPQDPHLYLAERNVVERPTLLQKDCCLRDPKHPLLYIAERDVLEEQMLFQEDCGTSQNQHRDPYLYISQRSAPKLSQFQDDDHNINIKSLSEDLFFPEKNTSGKFQSSILAQDGDIERDEEDLDYFISRMFDDDRFNLYTEDIDYRSAQLPDKLIDTATNIGYSTSYLDVNGKNNYLQCNQNTSNRKRKVKNPKKTDVKNNYETNDREDDYVLNTHVLKSIIKSKQNREKDTSSNFNNETNVRDENKKNHVHNHNTHLKTNSLVINNATEDLNTLNQKTVNISSESEDPFILKNCISTQNFDEVKDISKSSQKHKLKNAKPNNNLENEPVKKIFMPLTRNSKPTNYDVNSNLHKLHTHKDKENYNMDYQRQKISAKVSTEENTEFENALSGNDFKSPIIQHDVNRNTNRLVNLSQLFNNEVQATEEQYYTAIDELPISQSNKQGFRNCNIENVQEELEEYATQIRDLRNLSPPPLINKEISDDNSVNVIHESDNKEKQLKDTETELTLSNLDSASSSSLQDVFNDNNEKKIEFEKKTEESNNSDRTFVDSLENVYIDLCNSNSEDDAKSDISEIFNIPTKANIFKENTIEIIDLTHENEITLSEDEDVRINASINKTVLTDEDKNNSVKSISTIEILWKSASVGNQQQNEIEEKSKKVEKEKSCSQLDFENFYQSISSGEDVLSTDNNSICENVNNETNQVLEAALRSKVYVVLNADIVAKHLKKSVQKEATREKFSVSNSDFEDFCQKVSSEDEVFVEEQGLLNNFNKTIGDISNNISNMKTIKHRSRSEGASNKSVINKQKKKILPKKRRERWSCSGFEDVCKKVSPEEEILIQAKSHFQNVKKLMDNNTAKMGVTQSSSIQETAALKSDYAVKNLNKEVHKNVHKGKLRKRLFCSSSDFKEFYKVNSEDEISVTDKKSLFHNVNKLTDNVPETKAVKSISTSESDAASKSDCFFSLVNKEMHENVQKEKSGDKVSFSNLDPENFCENGNSEDEPLVKEKTSSGHKAVILSSHILQPGTNTKRLINEQKENTTGTLNVLNSNFNHKESSRQDLQNYSSDSQELFDKLKEPEKVNIQVRAKDNSKNEFSSIRPRKSNDGNKSVLSKSSKNKRKLYDLDDVSHFNKQTRSMSKRIKLGEKTDSIELRRNSESQLLTQSKTSCNEFKQNNYADQLNALQTMHEAYTKCSRFKATERELISNKYSFGSIMKSVQELYDENLKATTCKAKIKTPKKTTPKRSKSKKASNVDQSIVNSNLITKELRQLHEDSILTLRSVEQNSSYAKYLERVISTTRRFSTGAEFPENNV